MRKSTAGREMHEITHSLPSGYQPQPIEHFNVERIVLSKGSLDTPEREAFVRRICAAYPGVEVDERLETPHNRIDLGEKDPVLRHCKAKKTLLFGELKNAVRPSNERDRCPMYWLFSVYGYCPYGCKYCYLSGTRTYWFSPAVKIFVNLPEIIATIDWRARQCGRTVGFCLGKLQGGLALDPLTNFSATLVPFFAEHKYARQIVLTKSASVERLLGLDHRQNTILAWSLVPPSISAQYEENVPSIEERITAMRRCADKGYPVRAMLMPVVPHKGWEDDYINFVRDLLKRVPLQRLTLGGLHFSPHSQNLLERRMGKGNAISQNIKTMNSLADIDKEHAVRIRADTYTRIALAAKKISPNVQISYCRKELPLSNIADDRNGEKCNCVL